MTAQWKRIVRTKVKLGIRWDNGQAQPTGAWIDITLSEGSPPVNWQTYLKQKLTERGVECRDASGHVMVSAENDGSIKTVVADVDWAIDHANDEYEAVDVAKSETEQAARESAIASIKPRQDELKTIEDELNG